MSKQDWAARIAEWLNDHEYTCLADSNGVEVWRCQRPGSIHLAFDICINRFGISMFGDIDSLVFRVGASYGLPFLARDPDGYMIEKLDERYRKEREFDQACFHERLADAVFDLLDSTLEEDLLPEWMRDENQRRGKLSELQDWICEQLEDGNDAMAFDDLTTVLDQAVRIEDAREAHALLSENEELLDVGDTWEWRLTKPSESLVRRLHYVSHAARQILAKKEAEAGQAVQPC